MIDLTKRNNYVDGQFVDVDDFKTEQDYFLEKIRNITSSLSDNGSIDLRGLQVSFDVVMAEPVSATSVQVAIDPSPDITAPNPQNFTVFPDVLSASLTLFQAYTAFKTNTHNIQRLDLRVTLNQALTTENLNFAVRVRQLVDGTNPLSPLANVPPLAEVQFQQVDLPALDSDDFLSVDLSNENSGQGLSVVSGIYYAIELQFIRPVSSTSGIRLFHDPLNHLSQLDPDLLSFVLSNGKYTQNFTDTNGITRQFLFYHKLYTSAVKVSPGEALINGERTIVAEDQFRFLEVPDRRDADQNGLPVFNFVVLTYAEQFTDPQLFPNTKNTVDTRIKDTSSVSVLTQPQWDQLVADPAQRNLFLLLSVVSDTNIVSIFDKHTFNVPTNSTNLAFHDWLNPVNNTPTTEAVGIQAARPSDFIFFVSNVPAQVPLTDLFGTVQVQPTTSYDEFGNVIVRAGDPILDDIVRVVVNISLDNGKNTRSLELATVSEIGTTTKFKNYAGTISNLFDNPFDNVFTFNFNTDQLAPNTIYNFVAFTRRGLPVFIQDYNRTVSSTSSAGDTTLVRNQTFTVFLDKGSRTAVINQDLQLGAFNPASDQSQPGVVQFVPTLIASETLIPVGISETTSVHFNQIVALLPGQSFLFDSPMIRSDGITKIANTDEAIQTAYDAYDVAILVDLHDGNGPVDITFSGLTDRDRGGNGSTVLISGSIDATVPLPISTTAAVKVRNNTGRDNTNYSTAFAPYGPAAVGGPTNIRAFGVLARGFDSVPVPVSMAGFNDGDSVYIYIEDKIALDQNFQPITFIYNSLNTTVTLPTIRHLGIQNYFREKQIKSTETTLLAIPGVVLIDTGLGSDGYVKNSGQVIFNIAEIPTTTVSGTTVSLKYNSATIVPNNIDFYQTKFKPHGSRDGFKISNSNVATSSEFLSVPDALALSASLANSTALDPATFSTVAFFVDGINITSLLSPIGPKQFVADNGVTLQAGQIAYNPELGTIKFFKFTDGYSIVSEAPSDFTRLSASYFKLDTKFVFNTSTSASYEPKFDINNDGRIDEIDLNILNNALGSVIGDPNYFAAADFNSDGVVDSTDLSLFEQHFGSVALGLPDYSDATTARLGSLLVVKEDNFLTKLHVVRAVSRAPDATAPEGRTVLFFGDDTPVLEAGNYEVIFGFSAALSLGFIQVEIETARPLVGKFNLNNIHMFETANPTNTRSIIQVEASQVPNINNRFNSLLTFSPAINITSEFTIQSLWSAEGIAVRDSKDLIIPQKYEELDRKIYGPFKLRYTNDDFDADGTAVRPTLKDATLADGSPDPTGTHINGVLISELVFTAHLTIPNSDGTKSIWTWHNVQPNFTNHLVLEFDDALFVDHRTQGKNGAEVLTPFGLGVDQVALKPKFSGGDLENDLSNISVIRSDVQSRYVVPHGHTGIRDGGILTSHSIRFADDLARLDIDSGDMTDAIYKLLDIINQQEVEIQLIRALQGIVRWDSGFFWDDPTLFWDSN